MSGHSKWANIKRKKEANDAVKGKIFTKIGKEMAVAVKMGGPDPANNSKLAQLIAKAKSNNIPNDNIDRIIKKAAGEGDKNNYEEMVYEGYGPGGVAVIVECLTDNKNRTAGDVRHYFDKFGGNLGTSGCVSFMFTKKGTVILEYSGQDEDKLMEDCFEAGADDFNIDDEIVEVSCEPNDVIAVSEKLKELGYTVMSADSEMVPSTYTTLTDEKQLKFMGLLLENLEDNDDVQNVYHNWNAPEEEEED
ncbi:DNA-binding regulatory protein, YebC/PmpR family [Ruminococcus sp. YE71]|uniref:YebC/PmpR family DNA-binding transcriptional regulator n=1 Tax=unclassified Ruminococcus TaxID=2608920 RepID=UPI000886CA39|nr:MULTISPECIES: YebC/PmpR family DNA-binding transcriptional regulator [unclassified Ruminococcus]SDA29299.1 DNA-binding regulatory protein, YebC/PmpR family [Ruminococcus sp. YE78]SFW47955.1 DNA-binding regulatory protein, YebC/PmpR family [Ruminococcus sp. YE71]